MKDYQTQIKVVGDMRPITISQWEDVKAIAMQLQEKTGLTVSISNFYIDGQTRAEYESMNANSHTKTS